MSSSQPPRSTSPPVVSSVGVKSLRERFEAGSKRGAGAPVQTPAEFLRLQKEVAEREANELLLARKKVAAYNMAVRQMELERATHLKPLSDKETKTREELRSKARRVSTVLRNLDSTDVRPAEELRERRATNILLANMAEDLENELKEEEARALQEEEDAMRRTKEAKEDEERARAQEEEEAAKAEAEAATAAAEAAVLAAQAAREEVAQDHREDPTPAAAAPVKVDPLAKDRAVLTSYLRENYPEKLMDVEDLLKQFAGNLDVLFEELAKGQKFVETAPAVETEQVAPPAPKAVAAAAKTKGPKDFLRSDVVLRDVVHSFYSIFAQSKIGDIDDILKHFEGREADLFRTLEVKYDVTFSEDGTCVPNDEDKLGNDEPFVAASSTTTGDGKFAVDVQQLRLKEKLQKQGQTPEKIGAVLASGSGMM